MKNVANNHPISKVRKNPVGHSGSRGIIADLQLRIARVTGNDYFDKA